MEIISSTSQSLENQVANLKKYLIDQGVESPIKEGFSIPVDQNGAMGIIASEFEKIMKTLGLDVSSPHIKDTPRRIAKLYFEIFRGLNYDNFPDITTFPIESEFGMVRWDNISVRSWCEHHFLPVIGVCQVAYIPAKESGLFGLSKVNRIVDFFSSRPGTQERLTNQIFHTVSFFSGTQNVAVKIQANHGCISCRGVKDQGSRVTTTKFGGCFLNNESSKIEFLTIN